MAEQLSAQDGLYTVAEREPDAETSLRIIGAVASVETGPVRAIDAMAERATKLVTLTITEKGYDSTPEDSGPSPAPASVPALIARALARRPATPGWPLRSLSPSTISWTTVGS